MPGTKVNGFTIAYTAIGGIVLWSGITGTTLTTTFQDLLKGQAPSQNEEAIPIVAQSSTGSSSTGSAAPGNTGAANAGAAANQATAKLLAAPYGWSTGTQWADLVSLWNQESGWSNTAENPTSGAYGIAQALGHGPTNQYPAGAANPPTSSASAQISWGLSYIKSTYGSPSAAWAHEGKRRLVLMNGYLTPMLLLTGMSFANHWYNTKSVDLKILVDGGIATGILALINNVDGAAPVTAMVAWTAFVAVMIGPVQSPSPLDNIIKITGS